MPPHVPRKRLRQSPAPASKRKSEARAPSSSKRKPTLYDDLDAAATPLCSQQSASIAPGFGLDDSSSSLSSLSDGEFEDVPPAKRQKAHESGDDDDDDVEFEDVAAPSQPAPDAPAASGDLELTLIKDNRVSLTNSLGDKKGPSKRARKIRNATHCVHVMLLLWHNAIRNSWLCDPEVQAIMISHLPPGLWDEVDRWRRSSGLLEAPAAQKLQVKSQGRGRGKGRDRGLKADKHEQLSSESAPRDWGTAAKRLEQGAVDLSHGDPLFRLMQSLVSWWKQRFRSTTPGLRKSGYMALERLDRLTKAYAAEPLDSTRFGERIPNLRAFRQCAQSCRGSRDVGAQLFTSLLRGLGLEARMVANLPCLGFGWNKLEDAEPEREDGRGDNVVEEEQPEAKSTKQISRTPASSKSNRTAPKSSRRTRSSDRKDPTGDDGDELRLEHTDTDDESVVGVEITPKRPTQQVAKVDKDLEYPLYWSEVLSPVTNKYLPVDPIVKGTIATNRDLVESFEPRGAKADKARQVMAYVVGHSQDGTAKDVTVRYLKRQVLPGRTKGVRMPPEKIPVYGRHGKVKRHDQFDWFRSALSGYKRGGRSHPVTEIDHEEEAVDLKPAKAEKKEVKEGEETLQYYKQSKEFVLERHLKREEALKPDAVPVKVFRNKAKGGKVEEEDVFLRAHVVNVKSAETWHKQGRAPVAGEQPLKRVPYRAATLNRRREIIEAEAATGGRVLQGLFSLEQTELIIPPPIENGVIPKNEYGNIDLFEASMCPRGAVHVPYRGAVRVCKRLQIDFAEAVVGFEFGHRMAVPVIQGVVVAEEHHEQLMTELEKYEAERLRKEDEKRRKAVLGKWRKFIMGLRIVERIRQDYGEVDDSVAVFGKKQAALTQDAASSAEKGEDMAGGFLPEGYEEEAAEDEEGPMSSFFPVGDEEGEEGDGDGLIVEDDGQMARGADEGPETGGRAKGESRPGRKAAVRRSTRARGKVAVSDGDDGGGGF